MPSFLLACLGQRLGASAAPPQLTNLLLSIAIVQILPALVCAPIYTIHHCKVFKKYISTIIQQLRPVKIQFQKQTFWFFFLAKTRVQIHPLQESTSNFKNLKLMVQVFNSIYAHSKCLFFTNRPQS